MSDDIPRDTPTCSSPRIAGMVYGVVDGVSPPRYFGGAIPTRGFHTAWTAASTAAKMEGRIPHDMRRSAVRNLERASIPRKVAMQKVGHRTESIHRRYHIVAEADIHDAGAARRRSRRQGEYDEITTVQKSATLEHSPNSQDCLENLVPAAGSCPLAVSHRDTAAHLNIARRREREHQRA